MDERPPEVRDREESQPQAFGARRRPWVNDDEPTMLGVVREKGTAFEPSEVPPRVAVPVRPMSGSTCTNQCVGSS